MSRSLGYRRSQSCSPVCPTLSRGCRWRNRRLQGQVRSRLRVVFSRTHKHSLACVMHSPSVCHRRPTPCLRRRSKAQRVPRSRHSGDGMLDHKRRLLQQSTHFLTVVISKQLISWAYRKDSRRGLAPCYHHLLAAPSRPSAPLPKPDPGQSPSRLWPLLPQS